MTSKYPIPSQEWWQANGMPLKEIPVLKKDLKRLSREEKMLAAIATFPFLKKALIKSAIVFAIILIGVLAIVISGAGESVEVGIMILAACIVVAFAVSIKASALIDGFDIIEGSSILGLPFWFRLVKYFLTIPTMFLGGFGCILLIMVNRFDQSKMLGMPRIALPQNGGFDDFIGYYSEYENSVNAHAPVQSYSHYTLPQVEEKIKECKAAIKNIENDSTLTQSEKQSKINDWKKVLAQAEELRDKLKSNL